MSWTINLDSVYMGLCCLSHLDPWVLTSFIILPWLNLLHLSNHQRHMKLLHRETRTHCLLLKNRLVFFWLGCSHVNGRNGTNLPSEALTSSVRSQFNQVQDRDWKPKPCTQQSFSQLSSKANTEGSTLPADSILPCSSDRVRALSRLLPLTAWQCSLQAWTHLQHDHGVQTAIQTCYVLLSLLCCLSRLSLKPDLLLHCWPGRWAVCLGKISSNIYTEWKYKSHIIDDGWCCKVWI